MRVGVIGSGIATTERCIVGGGDMFQIYLLRVLHELGHQVMLCLREPAHWDTIEKDLGWAPAPEVELLYTPHMRAKSYTQFLVPAAIKYAKQSCDVTFNAYGDNLFWDTNLTYMHTPPTAEELSRKYGGPMKAYRLLYSAFQRSMKHRLHTQILTNSEYSRRIIRETLHMDAETLYPPIDTEAYRVLSKQANRSNSVVTIGRLTDERKLNLVLEVASKVKGAQFHIMGSDTSLQSRNLLHALHLRATNLEVQRRVAFHVNSARRERLRVLANCKVYLNTCPDEHFGMAIAEAMSAGLTPVVPDTGGQVEITGKLNTYANLEEAEGKIQDALGDWSPKTAANVSASVEKFSYASFKANLRNILVKALCG